MFTHADIRARVRQVPFVPFRIVTSSGQAFDIPHPDLVFVGVRDLMVGAAATNEPTYYDGVTRVAIMHITALQDRR
jgi:hypothetical protein